MPSRDIARLGEVLRPTDVFLIEVDRLRHTVLRTSGSSIAGGRCLLGRLLLGLLTLLFLLVLVGLK